MVRRRRSVPRGGARDGAGLGRSRRFLTLAPALAGFLAILVATLGAARVSAACRPAGDRATPPSVVSIRDVRGDGPLSDREIRGLFGAPGRDPAALRAALARVGGALVAAGHLEAALTLRLPSGELAIEAGPVAHWDTVRVQVRGGLSAPTPLVLEGTWVAERLEAEIAAWVREWAEAGHPFVVAEVESLVVVDGRVRAGLRLDPGPALAVQALAFPGLRATQQRFLERWLRFEAGGRFRDSDLERWQRRLERTGLFTYVGEARLEPTGEQGLRVHYPLEERPHNRIEGAIGYAGESETTSGRIDIAMGNLFGTGRALALRWERLRPEDSRLDLAYEEPLVLGSPVGLRIQVHQQIEDTTFTSDRLEGEVFADVARDLTVSFGYEVRRSVLGKAPSDLVRRGSTIFGLSWDTLRPGRLVGRKVAGTFRTGRSRVEEAGGAVRRERLERIEASAESYWRRGDVVVLRTVLRGGGIDGARDRALPPSEALWIGGSAGPRGWDEEAFATRRYLAAQLEVGAAIAGGRGRVYAFADGATFRSLATGEGAEEGGYGVGVASESVRRALVLDYGIPFGRSFGDSRIHLRLLTRF